MILRLTPLNIRKQPIDNINDLTFETVESIEDILFVRLNNARLIPSTHSILKSVTQKTGKIFVFIPENIQFFKLQQIE